MYVVIVETVCINYNVFDVMSMMDNINRLMGNKPKAFLVDDTSSDCRKGDVDIVKSMNVDIDQFSDFNKLLFKLRTSKLKKYKIGVIRENDTKYPSQVLLKFIKLIDPSIKIITYKTEMELERKVRHCS